MEANGPDQGLSVRIKGTAGGDERKLSDWRNGLLCINKAETQGINSEISLPLC